ncbi:tyrosine-type recombinase/integrase [Streptomyces sp. NPDC021212]|uniref:tyrosine-type recombinase/integrase n=1 Tax=Streptomyces sp. NPDC021212 TaxID=3365118 RepID=UPI003790EACD
MTAHAAEDRYPRPVVSAAEAEWIWRLLSVQALESGTKPETVRLAVIVGLARASGARYGGLLRCTMSSLDLDAGWVTIEHGKHRVPRRHGLDAGTILVLRRWLLVRKELCAELEGSIPDALLLTVHHTHDNGVTVAAGLPITRQGLVLSWRRFVHRTNARYAARRPPLPTRFEQVRRVWDT